VVVKDLVIFLNLAIMKQKFKFSIFIAILIGAGISIFNNHFRKPLGLNYSYSESTSSFIGQPLIGDLYIIEDTVIQTYTYFKVVWGNIDNGVVTIAKGKSIKEEMINPNWIVDAFNNKKLYVDNVTTFNPASINQDSLSAAGKNLRIFRQAQTTELLLFGKLMNSSIGFILCSLIAFLVIWFWSSTSDFLGRCSTLFPKFGNLVLLTYLYAHFFNNPTFYPSLGYAALFSLLSLIPTYLSFQWLNRKYFQSKPIGDREVFKFITIIILGVFFQILAFLITKGAIFQFDKMADMLQIYQLQITSKTLFQSYTLLLWTCIAFGNILNNYRTHLVDLQQQKKQLDFAKQKELQSQAELDALQARVNPHFLYNSLNSIAGLAQEDPAKTEEMAIALSHFFKYSTNRQTENWSTIEKEIEILETYLEIEKIRFGDRLQFQLTCPDELLAIKIPRFLLQPIVENAIKYGYDQTTNSIAIQINIQQKANQLVFQIYDGGKPFPDDMPSGYGLQSIRKKLALLYPEKHELAFINEPKKHVSITLFP